MLKNRLRFDERACADRSDCTKGRKMERQCVGGGGGAGVGVRMHFWEYRSEMEGEETEDEKKKKESKGNVRK